MRLSSHARLKGVLRYLLKNNADVVDTSDWQMGQYSQYTVNDVFVRWDMVEGVKADDGAGVFVFPKEDEPSQLLFSLYTVGRHELP